mmetsp:Transcript_38293/g.110602  ORF Transcript_38293/g.110602 Transcript_38293/m.110602 type:complete len:232 (-) Transcript_38293:1853-2548(-)
MRLSESFGGPGALVSPKDGSSLEWLGVVSDVARSRNEGGGAARGWSWVASDSSGTILVPTSVSWVPSSTFLPWSTTTILSLSLMVESRCAMTRAEPFLASMSSAPCTRRSFSASREAVASSSRMTSGLRTMARAIAMRCRWPPEKLEPPTCTAVMSLSGFSCRKSQHAASRQACSTSLSPTSRMPYVMFSRTLVAKRTVNWSTMTMRERRYRMSYSRMSFPSMRMEPFCGW